MLSEWDFNLILFDLKWTDLYFISLRKRYISKVNKWLADFYSFIYLFLLSYCLFIYQIIYKYFNPGNKYFWPGRPGFKPMWRHTKDFKKVLDTYLLNTQQYKVRIKGKVEQYWERCSSYWKGSLRVPLGYCHQLYLYIFIHMVCSPIKLYIFYHIVYSSITLYVDYIYSNYEQIH